jgi:suppressor of ftsI
MKLISKFFLYSLAFWASNNSFADTEKQDHSMHMGNTNSNVGSQVEKFSDSTKGLPFVKKAQVVKLKNGETFTLVATIVKQKIGNSIIRRYAYNGSIPGPIFEVQKGAKVKIKFINQTDSDQTLHSHGLRLDYKYDGVVGIGQKFPVKPGETFVYELQFPDAGIFWYHPHVREDYSQDMGLYGNYIVKDTGNKLDFINKQIPIVLDDLLIDKKAAPFYKNYANYSAMGRFGNVMLVNGVPDFSTEVNQGDVVRFYITNTANTRTFNFKIPNTKMKLIAGDASNYEEETWVNNVVIAPSERYTVDVLFEKPGTYQIESLSPQKSHKMGEVVVLDKKDKVNYLKQFLELHQDKKVISEIEKIKPFFNKPIDKKMSLTVDMEMDHGGDGEAPEEIEWEDSMPQMNAMMTSNDVTWELMDLDTKKKNMDIHWKFKKGSYYKISIFNDPKSKHPMQHPIHFHGQRFLVLSNSGVKNANLVWKDTVLVKAGDTVEILLEASTVGKWMAHCHIAEHLSSGMMMTYDVE